MQPSGLGQRRNVRQLQPISTLGDVGTSRTTPLSTSSGHVRRISTNLPPAIQGEEDPNPSFQMLSTSILGSEAVALYVLDIMNDIKNVLESTTFRNFTPTAVSPWDQSMTRRFIESYNNHSFEQHTKQHETSEIEGNSLHKQAKEVVVLLKENGYTDEQRDKIMDFVNKRHTKAEKAEDVREVQLVKEHEEFVPLEKIKKQLREEMNASQEQAVKIKSILLNWASRGSESYNKYLINIETIAMQKLGDDKLAHYYQENSAIPAIPRRVSDESFEEMKDKLNTCHQTIKYNRQELKLRTENE